MKNPLTKPLGFTRQKPVIITPVSSMKQERSLPSLGACILMDLIGAAVVVIPVAGELIWAPISAFIFWRMFGFRKGFLGGIFSFVEEMIPGLDFIPTFTIMWAVQFYKRKKGNISFASLIG
jgi:hypothetical protein